MKPYRFLEHTADVIIESFGRDLPEAFVNAGLGMTAYLFGDAVIARRATKTQRVAITSDSPESLLVDWLSKILWLTTTGYRAYVRFAIQQLADRRITASVGSLRAAARDDIKAVTYHDLVIEQTPNGWRTAVTYDL